ncbi:hypothetical protein DOY81_010607, partial [Sarcophaga bullata]
IEENPETKLTNVKEKRISQESLMEKLHLPTILSSNVNIKCPTSGSFIYPYHGNSDYYYTCINGQASLRACAEGYQYNVTQRRCVKPKLEEDNDMADFELKVPVEEIELFEVNCPLEGATIMAHSESKEKYILCMNGQPTVFDCAEGLFYNDKLKKCSEYMGEIATYQAALPGETNNIMCPKFGTFKYPHANDTHYYLCTDGKVYILACEKDEIFDSEINICRQKSETDMQRTETVTNDDNITDKPRATIVAEFASNIICPKLGTFMFPHSQRNRYYVCIDGHAIGFACADGYIYDSEVNACKPDSQTLQEEVPAPTLLDEPVNILCPSSGASKFPHLARNKFYLCINGMASVLACPQGTLFDAELSNCRTYLEQEQEDADSKVLTTSEVTVTCPKLGTFVYAHTNKTQYNVCLDGQPIVLTCNEGLIFDPKEKIGLQRKKDSSDGDNNSEILKQHNQVLYATEHNRNDIATTDEKDRNVKPFFDLKASPTVIVNTTEGDNNSSVELKVIPTENVEASQTRTPDESELNKSMKIQSFDSNKFAQNFKVEDREELVDLKAISTDHVETVDTLKVSETLEADSFDSSDGENNSEILKQHNHVLYAIEHNRNEIATTEEEDPNVKTFFDLTASPTEIVNSTEGDNNSSVELKVIPTENVEASQTRTPDESELNKSMKIQRSDSNKFAQNFKVEDREELVNLKAIPTDHVETVDTLKVSETLEADSLDSSDGDNNSEILKQHNQVLYAIKHNRNDIATIDEKDEEPMAEII